MEEWSSKQKISAKHKSLADIYCDLLPKPPCRYSSAPNQESDILYFLKQYASSLNLKNLFFRQYTYTARNFTGVSKDYALFLKTKRLFLKFMACKHLEECRKLNLTDTEIKQMHAGIIPENINIHLKVPFDFGGQCSFENMALIRTHPHHLYLHRLIEYQFEQGLLKKEKKLFIPCFEGYAYYG